MQIGGCHLAIAVPDSFHYEGLHSLHNTHIATSYPNLLQQFYAPEHLILHIDHAEQYQSSIVNAGSVFVGGWSPEAAGDYASGTNHVLPTYGYAHAYSGLSLLAFMKQVSFQTLTQAGLQSLAKSVIKLADIEGLDAHANAVRIRLPGEQR